MKPVRARSAAWLGAALAALWVLVAVAPGQSGVPHVCGDGVEEGPETCDDSNTVSGDGCDESCQDEVCGNGVVQPGTPPEQCDDGNATPEDGCDAACQFECGNGAPNTGEACDDGNTTNGDGCDDDAANGGNCSVTGCLNGVVTAGEQCDDGNTVAGDGCEPDCTTESPIPEPDRIRCVVAVNKNLAGVLKARGGDDSACLRSVAAGKSDLATCYGNDLKDKVAKAGAKTTQTIGKKCNDPNEIPHYAFTDAATVNGAGDQEPDDAFAVVFGATPSIVAKSADKPGAACQAEVLKQLNALTHSWIGEANKAKKSALEGGKRGTPPPVGGASPLATAIDTAVAASTKIAKAESKANAGIAKKCADDAAVDALFECNAATTVNAVTLCVIAAGKEAACNALETADALDMDCPSAAAP